ncbi:MAG: hypothetical protein ACI4S3_00105 [Candidatus Gastranaerophilaceae bacterium]
MYNQLKNENVIVDLKILLSNEKCSEETENMKAYLEFIKLRMLDLSGTN